MINKRFTFSFIVNIFPKYFWILFTLICYFTLVKSDLLLYLSFNYTVLLYNGALLCGFNVPIKGLKCSDANGIVQLCAVISKQERHGR